MSVKVFSRGLKDHKMGVYLNVDGNEYYLFSQEFHQTANNFFRDGVDLDAALKAAKTYKKYGRVQDVARKLESHIKYIEDYYEISVLKKTCKKASKTSCYDKKKQDKKYNKYKQYNRYSDYDYELVY